MLQSLFESAKSVGNQSKIKAKKTETGVKDTYLDHFLDAMASSYANITGRDRKQEALAHFLTSLPSNVTSPVWKILGICSPPFFPIVHSTTSFTGLNPHSDTPIEILHVILLGFVKYLWRDVVQNQIKKKNTNLEVLIARLSSFDVSGLGISQLSGQTLVQYAGSLTGRDFRAIAQVAPFVLYDLVTPACYQTWVALSNLIPLVWQPAIEDINTHVVSAYHPLFSNLLTLPIRYNRSHLKLPLRNFFCALQNGHPGGSTNLNFMFSFTFRNTFVDLVQLYSLLQKGSNPLMPSYALKASIQTDKHHPATLPMHLRKVAVFGTFSVVDAFFAIRPPPTPGVALALDH